MCNCIEEVEKLLTETFESEVSVEDKVNVQLDGKSFNFSRSLMQLSTNVTAKYQKNNKNKVWRNLLVFTFCPFCGEEYIKETIVEVPQNSGGLNPKS